jgi:hypothetical protein
MIFITYNGATLALCLAQPNWDQDLKVEISTPWAEVTEAQSGAEARQPFGESARYMLEYVVDTSTAKESTDLRMWLLRLRDETVAVPMWADYVESTNSFNAGATSIPLAYGPPVNYGAEWIILSPDGLTYEIVVVDSVTATNITLHTPGAALNWPAGSRLYPLLFGHIIERPKFKGETDEIANGTIKIKESSPYARRLNPFNPGTNAIVGSGIPAFTATRLFNVRPHHSEPIDTTEIDFLLTQIGFGREQSKYAGPYAAVRGTEHEFIQLSRTEIASLAWLWIDRQGPMRRFMCPTFRGDLRLTQDLPIPGNSSLITIEASRYTDPDYSTNPGAPFLALVDRNNITAVEITLIDGAGLHTAVAMSQSYKRDETKLSNLLLCRFVESKLSWTYGTDGLAGAKLKVVEVPNEYSDPPTEPSPIAYLLQFQELVDVPLDLGRYTTYERSLTYSSQTWQPGPFSLATLKEGLDLSDKLEVTTFDFDQIEGVLASNPVRKILEGTLEGELWCNVVKVNASNPDDGGAVVIFAGKVTDLDVNEKEWKATITPFDFERNVPRFYKQKVCNVPLFHPKCAAGRPTMKEDFKSVGTLFSISDTTIQISAAIGFPDLTTKPTDYFAGGGWIEAGTGATFERRTIHHNETISGRLQCVISRKLLKTSTGAQMRLWPGCNGSIDICDTVFNNRANHRAQPYAPNKNPSADIPEVQQAAGGKKG